MGNIMDMPLWCWKEDDVIFPTLSKRATFEGRALELDNRIIIKNNNYVVPLKTREREKKIRINSFFL